MGFIATRHVEHIPGWVDFWLFSWLLVSLRTCSCVALPHCSGVHLCPPPPSHTDGTPPPGGGEVIPAPGAEAEAAGAKGEQPAQPRGGASGAGATGGEGAPGTADREHHPGEEGGSVITQAKPAVLYCCQMTGHLTASSRSKLLHSEKSSHDENVYLCLHYPSIYPFI